MNLRLIAMSVLLMCTMVPVRASQKSTMSKKELILKTAVNTSAIIVGLCTMYLGRYSNVEAAERLMNQPKEMAEMSEEALLAAHDKKLQDKLMIYHHLDHALDRMKLGALFVLYGLYGLGDTCHCYNKTN